jgi:hypothetical protein
MKMMVKMCNLLFLLLPTLVFCQSQDTMQAHIEMKHYALVADSTPFAVRAQNVDSLSYSVWYHARDDDGYQSWVERSEPQISDLIGLDGVTEVQSYFRTCEPSMVRNIWGELVCDRRWLRGDWEVRVRIWRWRNGVKEEKLIVKGFRVL